MHNSRAVVLAPQQHCQGQTTHPRRHTVLQHQLHLHCLACTPVQAKSGRANQSQSCIMCTPCLQSSSANKARLSKKHTCAHPHASHTQSCSAASSQQLAVPATRPNLHVHTRGSKHISAFSSRRSHLPCSKRRLPRADLGVYCFICLRLLEKL